MTFGNVLDQDWTNVGISCAVAVGEAEVALEQLVIGIAGAGAADPLFIRCKLNGNGRRFAVYVGQRDAVDVGGIIVVAANVVPVASRENAGQITWIEW